MSQTQERLTRFTAFVRVCVDACGKQAQLEGSLAFRRWVVDEEDQATQRALEHASLSLRAKEGVRYQLVGTADLEPAEALVGDAAFDVVYRGVLVGSGPLNNHLLTLALRVVEHPDGTAKADVLHVRVGWS